MPTSPPTQQWGHVGWGVIFKPLQTWSPWNRFDWAPFTSSPGCTSSNWPPPLCMRVLGWLLCQICHPVTFPKATICFIIFSFRHLICHPKGCDIVPVIHSAAFLSHHDTSFLHEQFLLVDCCVFFRHLVVVYGHVVFFHFISCCLNWHAERVVIILPKRSTTTKSHPKYPPHHWHCFWLVVALLWQMTAAYGWGPIPLSIFSLPHMPPPNNRKSPPHAFCLVSSYQQLHPPPISRPLIGFCVYWQNGGHLRSKPCSSLNFSMGALLVPKTRVRRVARMSHTP